MKIAFVYDAVYPWEKGGAQKRILEMAQRLSDHHEVHMYGMHYWDGPKVMWKNGINYHGVCEPRELYVNGRRSIAQALAFGKNVFGPLLREEFDIVDCQQFPYFPCFSAKLHELLKQSTVLVTWYEVWDDYWYEYLGWKGVFGKAVERAALELPNHVITISEKIASDVEALGRRDGLSVVPNGVDYAGIQEISPVSRSWDVIYVGRLSEHKNLDVLLDAVSILVDRHGREVDCCVIGDGPERATLEAHARERNIDSNVDFLGFVDQDADLIANLKAAKAFVLPSTREGFPNTILEANACGLPSIVVDHPENGATAVVEDGETGYVTSLSASGIADTLQRLLGDDDLRRRLSANARSFARRHDWDRIVGRLEEVYTDARETGRHAGRTVQTNG